MPPVSKSVLQQYLKEPVKTPKAKPSSGALWKGPEEDGVTFSLLSRFLCCRERFRLLVVEGWRAVDNFSAPLEFGQMWHKCEEALADSGSDWRLTLDDYTIKLVNRYRLQQQEVLHWHDMAEALFPEYVKHWSSHPDVQKRTPLMQEQVFDIPYRLPSGRTVRLRGKWDSVDLIEEAPVGVYVGENKTKSQVDRVKLTRQLSFDLQTLMYLVALQSYQVQDKQYRMGGEGIPRGTPILGARYNVVRRSAHKTPESMLKKYTEDRAAGRIDEWFLRFRVEVAPTEVQRFRRECLDPILEQLIQWWEWVTSKEVLDKGPFYDSGGWGVHFRYPFGVYDPIREGGFSEVDEYLETGSTRGLQRITNLFPELSE